MKIYIKKNVFDSIYVKLVFDKFIEEFKDEEMYKLYNFGITYSGVHLNCNLRKYKDLELEEVDLHSLNYNDLKMVVRQLKMILSKYYFVVMEKEILEFVNTVKEIKKNNPSTKDNMLNLALEEITKLIENKKTLSNSYYTDYINNWIDMIKINSNNKTVKIFLSYNRGKIYYLENSIVKSEYKSIFFSDEYKIKEYELLFNEQLLKNLKKNLTQSFLKKLEKEKKKSIETKKTSKTLFNMILFKDLILENLQEIEKHITI